MEKFKVGLIGLGHQGTSFYLPALRKVQHADLVAVSDIDKAKLSSCSQTHQVSTYPSYLDMLVKEQLDFVIVATPHDAHSHIIEEAAKRNIHVLKEKPYGRNLLEAFKFKSLAEESGIHLCSGLQRRLNPIHNSFFTLIKDIGEPFFLEMKYTFFFENPHEGWRGNKSIAGGGCILDMGYHMIDLLIWYFGLPQRVCAHFSAKATPETARECEDTALITFAYQNGLYGSLFLSRFHAPKMEEIKICGSKGIIELNKAEASIKLNNGEVIKKITFPIDETFLAAQQIDGFCDHIRGKQDFSIPVHHHLQLLAFIESCYASKAFDQLINPHELLCKIEQQFPLANSTSHQVCHV